MGTLSRLWAASLLAAVFAGCASDSALTSKPAGSKARPMAVAVLSPTQGNKVTGQVTFIEETEGIRVTANITGLSPGAHGFHIHEAGDCSAPDASSAKGHFNPTGAPHGAPKSAQHHIGDLGNITADSTGTARFEMVFPFLTFTGANSILGRAVIVHEKADDLTTQPTGNAGGRLACGVIETVKK